MPLRVACVQSRHGSSFEATLEGARRLVNEAGSRGAKLVLFPEYFFLPDPVGEPPGPPTERAPEVRAFLADCSRELGIAVAGNVIERRPGGIENVGVAYERGKLAGEQVKIHPMPREMAWDYRGGSRLAPFGLGGIAVGLVVCADILYPEVARILSLRGSEILLNPVMSPFEDVDPTKDARTALYVARAYDSGAFVLKSGGFAPVSRHIVGRSLITAPWGVLARADHEWKEAVIVADLDFDALRAFRANHRGILGRENRAYADLSAA